MSGSALPVTPMAVDKKSVPRVASSTRKSKRSWHDLALEAFGVAPFCRWPANQPPPQVLLLRILAAKDAKFVTGGIVFGSRSGATKFLVNVLELRGVRDVVQPFPSIHHFLFTTSLLPSEMEDLGIRSGVLRLRPGLGFDIRAVSLHRSRWVPFVVEGVIGKVDVDKFLEAIGDLRGVKSVSEDLRHLEDRLGVRDGRMQGKLKFLEDDECSGDDTTVLRKWKKSHFTHTVEVDGVDYVARGSPNSWSTFWNCVE